VSRDWLLFLDDIVLAAEKIGRMTENRGLDAFIHEEPVFDAVLMNLLIIGEATKNLPPEALANMPDIDWSGAAGLRDIIAHRYFGIDQELVWDIVQNHVPPLLEAASAFRTRLEDRLSG
jgi:uncharacterized protein with HEPN domain